MEPLEPISLLGADAPIWTMPPCDRVYSATFPKWPEPSLTDFVRYFFRRATTLTLRVSEIAPGVNASFNISANSC